MISSQVFLVTYSITSSIVGLVVASFVPPRSRTVYLGARRASSAGRLPWFAKLNGAAKLLAVYGFVALGIGILAIIHYRYSIETNVDRVFLASGLLLAMIGGMFVRVIARNRAQGHQLLATTTSDFVFPLLFCLIVFFPIWALAGSHGPNLFDFYAAFLNGYCWETAVTTATKTGADLHRQNAGSPETTVTTS